MKGHKWRRVLGWGVIGALTFGAVGFLCGFFGSFLLSETPGNVAPLIGIFITGPIALVVGGLLGVVAGASRLHNKRIASLLCISLILVSIASLALTAPPYKPVAQLVEGEILSCEDTAVLAEARKQHWRSEVERVTRERLRVVRDDWENDVEHMVASRPSAVVNL